MIINITAGEELNKIMAKENECWVPFNEALSQGEIEALPFSVRFMEKRAASLGVDSKEYLHKLSPFIKATRRLDDVQTINLYFGSELFCMINAFGVITYLEMKEYFGKIYLNIVNETNGNIEEVIPVKLGSFIPSFELMIKHDFLETNIKLIDKAIEKYINK